MKIIYIFYIIFCFETLLISHIGKKVARNGKSKSFINLFAESILLCHIIYFLAFESNSNSFDFFFLSSLNYD